MFDVYKHFKGELYLKLCEAFDIEAQEIVIVYKALYKDEVLVCSKSMFEDYVRDGSIEGKGDLKRKFEKVV